MQWPSLCRLQQPHGGEEIAFLATLPQCRCSAPGADSSAFTPLFFGGRSDRSRKCCKPQQIVNKESCAVTTGVTARRNGADWLRDRYGVV